MRQQKLLRIAPTGDDFSITQVEMEDLVDIAFADEQFLADNQEPERIAKAGPIRDMLSAIVENLHALIAAISDIDSIVRINRQAVCRRKFARRLSFFAPL